MPGPPITWTASRRLPALRHHSARVDCRRPHLREVADLDILISAYDQIPPADDITRLAYYLLKAHAKSAGLRTLDALIAATAIENGFTLVSRNRKHFQMIGELKLEVPSY